MRRARRSVPLVALTVLLATGCTGGSTRDGGGASAGDTAGSDPSRRARGVAEPVASAPPSPAATSDDEEGRCRASWRPSEGGSVVTVTADASSVVITTTTKDGDAGPRRELDLLEPADELELELSSEEDVTALVVTADGAPCDVSRRP